MPSLAHPRISRRAISTRPFVVQSGQPNQRTDTICDTVLHPELMEQAIACAQGLAAGLRDRAGGNLIAVYLHGSAALGGWLPGRSDIDVLIVATDDTGEVTADSMARAIWLPASTVPCQGWRRASWRQQRCAIPARRGPTCDISWPDRRVRRRWSGRLARLSGTATCSCTTQCAARPDVRYSGRRPAR